MASKTQNTPARRRSKIGRNDPCHCGSGKKYKRCHLPIERDSHYVHPRTPPAEVKGTLFGKRMLVTADPATFDFDDLRRHLSRFSLVWTLRRIAEVGKAIGDSSWKEIEGIPVATHCLAFLALTAIESSTDENPRIPNPGDIAEAARIYNGLGENYRNDGSDAFEAFIRIGYAQFSTPRQQHAIPRNWMLYRDTWYRCKKAARFDIASAIFKETGLSLQQLMVLTLAYGGRSASGYCSPYSDENLKTFPGRLGIGPEEQAKFLKRVTASYAEIRELGAKTPMRSGYEKYRLNPLLLKPVVRPDSLPEAAPSNTLLVPARSHLVRRITDGLYHDLATAYDLGGGENPFRVAFGYAFQAYVGELLAAASGKTRVLPEWSYGPKGKQRTTPDWMILDGNKLVVVEVKQSALTLDTKMFGDLAGLADDLRRTLVHGVQQLLKFRTDVLDRHQGLKELHGVDEVELVLLTYDAIPWANWILRDALAKQKPEAEDIHLISVQSFEDFQRYYWGDSPFALLRKKRLGGSEASQSDFNEWLYTLRKPKVDSHPFIERARSDFNETWRSS